MLTVFVIAVSFGMLQTSYAQTQNEDNVGADESVTLSGDLTNNPLAQDILKKIEQTKKWIEELEQRNYEQLEKQQELDEKRRQAIVSLEQDLKEWELLWEYYSPRNSFERFVDKVPDSQVQGVFWDQFEFKEQKVQAGRDALKKVISNGGSLEQARQAYLVAAETKRIELIEANSQFNVRHNLAYYNQQILFDQEGQFIDSPITGEQLREYYDDFRTNPAYLNANPNDVTSWEDLGRTNKNTECRDGYVVVHRFNAQDYVCVTLSTAEMWIRHGMGEITGDSETPLILNLEQSVNPLTNCDDNFSVVYNTETEKYSCMLEATANEWVEQGIGEIHDPEEFIMQSIERKEHLVVVEEINQQINKIRNDLEVEKIELKKEFDVKYDNVSDQLRDAEKEMLKDYGDKPGMSKKELSTKIIFLRDRYDSEKEEILQNKIKAFDELEQKYEQKMDDLIRNYETNPYVRFTSNSGQLDYEAVLNE